MDKLFESLILDSNNSIALTPATTLICAVCALVLGLIISAVYMLTNERYTKDYVITLVVLPVLVMTVIMMVNGNVGTGIATMGAFSLVRFRSIPGTAKEIAIIFFSMAAGLSCGLGYIGYASLITILLSFVLLIMHALSFGEQKKVTKVLKITIPEDLNYQDIFNDIFEKYTVNSTVTGVKTTNLGSLFIITYNVQLKAGINEKEFIDEIRCRNGNLTVSLNIAEDTLSL